MNTNRDMDNMQLPQDPHDSEVKRTEQNAQHPEAEQESAAAPEPIAAQESGEQEPPLAEEPRAQYPPQGGWQASGNNILSEHRQGDYASTGYGGEQGYDHTRRQQPAQNQQNPYVPPFAPQGDKNNLNTPPYGAVPPYGNSGKNNYQMNGFDWNFADYDSSELERKKKKKKSRGVMVLGTVLGSILALSVLFLSVTGMYSMLGNSNNSGGTSSQPTPVPGLNIQDKPEVDPSSTSGYMSNVDIIKKVSPSVVGIAAYKSGSSFAPSSEGSGIIMTADGYIVTNAHVIENAVGITVVLENGDTYAAKVIGADSKTDLAVLKIEATNLVYAEFGNSDKLERGESVLAIGNPGGLQFAGSVTGGLISGINRSLSSATRYSTSYIQVDAAINPGNSGGALVNQYGQVIGINSAKIAATEYEGIGFAIPINEALPIIEEIMANGYVTGRPELGITGRMVDSTLASFRRLPVGFGIESINPNSDLINKNVVPGDIITHINDTAITSSEDVANILADFKPGDSVKLKIYRQSLTGGSGKSFEVDVILVESGSAS